MTHCPITASAILPSFLQFCFYVMAAVHCLTTALLLLFSFASSLSIPKGELVEWDLDLFGAANEGRNAQCESTKIMDPPGHSAGYFSIDGTKDGHLFYMYFENRAKDPDAPFVFWTNGGPGCSSFYGLFLENGPYEIQKDLSLCWREHGWDVGHNIVFVEQPIGVGFSYSHKSDDRVFTEKQVGHDMVHFFKAFLKQHPELENKELYITGESFGGHYLPEIAKAISISNAHQSGKHLNLKGVFMVDPWTSPSEQYYSYPIYAYQEKLISESTRDKMLSSWSDCDNALKFCALGLPLVRQFSCNAAYAFCQSRLFQPVLFIHPLLNYYDIRRRDCIRQGCYDVSLMTRFLNSPNVKRAIGAKHKIYWEDCRSTIRRDLGWDVATDVKSTVSEVLNHGIKMSIAVGDRDLICNYIGNERWVDRLAWDKTKQWAAAPKKTLEVNGASVGYVREAAQLSFIKVEDAGHMIPMDQPVVGLEIITAFTHGKPFPTGDVIKETEPLPIT